MFHLMMTVMAIALVGILTMISVSYLPGDYKHRDAYSELIDQALPKLEKAYDVATQANGGVAPAVAGGADGGFSSNFLTYLKFTPALPPTMSISYGMYSGTNARYTGMNYFCIKTDKANEYHISGTAKSKHRFSADQYFVSDTCGKDTNTVVAEGSPLRLTFFVAYVPAVTP